MDSILLGWERIILQLDFSFLVFSTFLLGKVFFPLPRSHLQRLNKVCLGSAYLVFIASTAGLRQIVGLERGQSLK